MDLNYIFIEKCIYKKLTLKKTIILLILFIIKEKFKNELLKCPF